MRILIIRPGAVGDALLTFPIIQALRRRYAHPHITLVSNPAVLPLAVEFGLAEAISDYGQLQWSELFAPTGIQQPALREQLHQIDLAICWLRDPAGIVEHNLYAAGAKDVVAAPGRPVAGERIHVVDYLAKSIGLDPIDKLFQVVGAGEVNGKGGDPCAPMKTKGDRKGPHPTSQPLPPLRRKKGVPAKLSIPVREGERLSVAVHPGSGGKQKCWPVACFADSIQQLWQYNYAALVLIGPADHERWAELSRLLPKPPEPAMLKVLVDKPLMEVAEQIQGCRCYLGNDAGITHLAALLGVPTVVLFGPSDPTIWRPLGPSVEIIQSEALEGLSVTMVIESISRCLLK